MSSTNGHSTTAAAAPATDEYTRKCQDVSGPKADPRAKLLADSFMKHLHAWAREVDLTTDEWLYGCKQLMRAGHISDEKRNEFILLSDVLGLESLLDNMAHERAQKAAAASGAEHDDAKAGKATESAILGPFYREDAPRYEMGADIVLDHSIQSAEGKKGETTTMHGVVKGVDGKPIEGAEIDVWHTGPNGLYEQQDPAQPEYNYRGLFKTGADGAYSFRCLRPTPYPIPYDNATGDLLQALDRSPMRPAHIHFLVRAPGHVQLITQIYDRACPYVARDSVFGTKDSLVVDFRPPSEERKKVVQTQHDVQYDITLVPKA